MDHHLNNHEPEVSKQEALENVLRAMNEMGEFEASVLTDTSGLPIVAASSVYSAEVMAAITALIRNVARQVQKQLTLTPIREVTITTEDRLRLVYWPIILGEELLFLLAVIPPRRSYRRVMNRASKALRQALLPKMK